MDQLKGFCIKLCGILLISTILLGTRESYSGALNAQSREENVRITANAIAQRLPFNINAADAASKKFIDEEVLPRLDRGKIYQLSVNNMLEYFTDKEISELDRLTSSPEGIAFLSKIATLMVVSGRSLDVALREIIACIPKEKRPLSLQQLDFKDCSRR